MRRWVSGLVGWCIFALASCGGPEVVYNKQQDFPNGGWAYADSVTFVYPVTDTTAQYDLVLTVDHTTDFAYQNFYVQLDTYLPDGQHLSQPLSLQLADNFGEWYGECSKESCVIEIALQQGTRFTEIGEHRLVVTQFSREDELQDITEVGFRIVKP